MLLIFVLVYLAASLVHTEFCRSTSVQEILEAAYHADFAYNNVSVGDSVSRLPEYKVKMVVVEKLPNTDDPFKAVITERQNPPVTFITFQGSKPAIQFFNEFWSMMQFRQTVTWNGEVLKIVGYFWKAFNLLDFHNLYKVDPHMKYIIVGHSLGGALASLYAVAMTHLQNGALWKNRRTRLITFGEPRIGDKAYASFHDRLIPPFKKLRVINHLDFIPHFPPKNYPLTLPYCEHYSREIWAQTSNMDECAPTKEGKVVCKKKVAWRVCPLGDSDQCSNSMTITPIGLQYHYIVKYIEKIEWFAEPIHKYEQKKFRKDQCRMTNRS